MVEPQLTSQTLTKFELADFQKEHIVGRGSRSQVWLAKRKGVQKYYALKEIDISQVNSKEEAQHLWNEKTILSELSNLDPPFPRACSLYGTMKEDEAIYLVLEFVCGAPLHEHFRKAFTTNGGSHAFSEERARFYCCELIETLGILHEKGIVYRDVKASNVMLDARTGHLKLVDFGFAKKLVDSEDQGIEPRLRRTSSLCGTFHAMAPEVRAIEDELHAIEGSEPPISYTQSVDWWSLGILVFEMLTAKAPFGYKDGARGAGTTIKELSKQSPESLEFPDHVTPDARSFISGLLTAQPESRLGSQSGASEVKMHPWLAGFDWNRVSSVRAMERLPRLGLRQRPGAPPDFDRTIGEYPPSSGESESGEEEDEEEEDESNT